MKLATKLLAAPLLTAIVVFSAGALNAWMMSRDAQATHTEFRGRLADFKSLASTQDQLGQIHSSVYRNLTIIGSMEEPKIKALREDLSKQLEGVKRNVAQVVSDETDAYLKASADKATKLADKYRSQADAAIDLSSVDPNTGVAAMQSADATYTELARALGAMVERSDSMAKTTMDEAVSRSTSTNAVLAALGLLAALVAVLMSWLMQRRIVVELQRAASVANEVASGNLGVDASSERSDEVGDVMHALQKMTDQLNASMKAVLESSESIHSASAEIASGTQDLSSRTEQAASSLEQTASSMEELTGTVNQSADSARQANQLASSAAAVAARGGAVVSQVVSTMDDINTSSRKIADIISVIDGIAFQTNILALNAAVEAARAGEQGRGFAVVATEVRSLAGRSAQAAREIKALIGASVEKVEGGSRLVADAGRTMTEIVSSVQRVSDIIGEISAAAGEQSSGIAQVNQAVSHLDQMTQQNAALVEQSTAAAESLKEQAGRLAQVVSTFRLTGVATRIATQRPPSQPLRAAPQRAIPAAPPRPKLAAKPAAPLLTNRVKPQPPKALGAPVKPKPKAKANGAAADEWESF